MNKKSFVMLFCTAMLGFGSCNDIQDMNLNFGERVYTNDYKNLVEAINNLSSSVKDRFDALSQLLQKGLGDIKVSIDENTGAIKVLSQDVSSINSNMKDGLDKINTSLFNGFTTLSSTIDATGKSIITAIDNNGNLLRLQIDETGKLLSTQITTSLTNGFTAISNIIDASGKSIIAAVDNNGNLLRLKIDETGKLLSSQIINSNNELIKFLKEGGATLAEKFDLIEAAIKIGFVDQKQVAEAINAAVLALKDEVAAGHKSNEDALKEIKAAVSDQTADLSSKFALVQSTRSAGLTDQKQAVEAIITAINTLSEQVKAGNKSTQVAQKEIKSAIDGQTSSLDEKLVTIKEVIEKGLADVTDKENLIIDAVNALSEQVKAGNKSSEDALKEIKTAIEGQTISLEDKLKVINESVDKGLVGLSAKTELVYDSVKALKAEVTAGNKSNEDALKEIKTAIEGQTTSLVNKLDVIEGAMKESLLDVSAKTQLVEEAVNKLKAAVEAGNKSSEDALKEIKAAIESQTTSLNDKLDVIDKSIDKGLAGISEKAGLIDEAVKSLKKSVDEGKTSNDQALNEIKAAITSQTTDLSSKVDLLTSTIEKGFAADQTALSAISTAITDLKTKLSDGTTTLANGLQQLLGALNAIDKSTSGTKEKLEQIKVQIENQLKDTGVIFAEDGKSFTATQDVWTSIETAGKNSSLYKMFFDAITATEVNVEYQNFHGKDRYDLGQYINVAPAASLQLVPIDTTTGTGENPPVVKKVVKSYPDIPVTFTPVYQQHGICCVRVYDARGDFQVFPSTYTGTRQEIGEATSLDSDKLNKTGGPVTISLSTVDNEHHKIVDHKIIVVVWFWQSVPFASYIPAPVLFWPSTKQ